MTRRVGWGERIAVVGDNNALGAWQPGNSLPLLWREGDVWSAEVSLTPGVHEFKVSVGRIRVLGVAQGAIQA